MAIHVPFENTYARLPEHFYARVRPAAMPAARLIRLNTPLAHHLGLDVEWLASREGVAMLAGNAVPEGAEPIALAYAGHQFGYFVPQLGDGRAILLGEVVAPDGARFDIQLKGSGRTPFSVPVVTGTPGEERRRQGRGHRGVSHTCARSHP